MTFLSVVIQFLLPKFAALQKHAQEYSVKLNLDTSKQSILQPKAYIDTENKIAATPKDLDDQVIFGIKF